MNNAVNSSVRRADRALAVTFDRQGARREIAYAAPLLISNESSFVNPHTLPVEASHMAGILRA
jgi:hypothetical protein